MMLIILNCITKIQEISNFFHNLRTLNLMLQQKNMLIFF